MFILLLKRIEQSKACACSCPRYEKHSGAGAAVITGKKVCVPPELSHAVCVAPRAVAERLLQSIQIREGPRPGACVRYHRGWRESKKRWRAAGSGGDQSARFCFRNVLRVTQRAEREQMLHVCASARGSHRHPEQPDNEHIDLAQQRGTGQTSVH